MMLNVRGQRKSLRQSGFGMTSVLMASALLAMSMQAFFKFNEVTSIANRSDRVSFNASRFYSQVALLAKSPEACTSALTGGVSQGFTPGNIPPEGVEITLKSLEGDGSDFAKAGLELPNFSLIIDSVRIISAALADATNNFYIAKVQIDLTKTGKLYGGKTKSIDYPIRVELDGANNITRCVPEDVRTGARKVLKRNPGGVSAEINCGAGWIITRCGYGDSQEKAIRGFMGHDGGPCAGSACTCDWGAFGQETWTATVAAGDVALIAECVQGVQIDY